MSKIGVRICWMNILMAKIRKLSKVNKSKKRSELIKMNSLNFYHTRVLKSQKKNSWMNYTLENYAWPKGWGILPWSIFNYDIGFRPDSVRKDLILKKIRLTPFWYQNEVNLFLLKNSQVFIPTVSPLSTRRFPQVFYPIYLSIHEK